MKLKEILNLRIENQLLNSTIFKKPSEIIQWFCGIQGQDYEQSKWAIGLRLPGMTDELVEKAYANRSIIRTWLMRGTLHIVSAQDIHWLTDLLAPRLKSSQTGRNKELELDDKIFKKCNAVFNKILKGNKELTREELAAALEKSGIDSSSMRLYHILQNAGLDHVLCFGKRRGKQFTFTLLNEKIEPGKSKQREEALVELAKRYFTSRGPATLKDFIWWSGLSTSDARLAIELSKSDM